jgi:hypothetical protein
MASLRPVSAEEIESLAIGAWILGTGGGGSPYLALLNMRRLYAEGAVVSLMDPMDLADDDHVAVVSNMGAPLVGQERLTDPRTIARAVTMMEEYPTTGATGAGWERTPWRVTQRAAWEALRKASQEAYAQSALRAALQEGRANGNPRLPDSDASSASIRGRRRSERPRSINRVATEFKLTDAELLPSGKQAISTNRVQWAKTYLVKAGFLQATKRGHLRSPSEAVGY